MIKKTWLTLIGLLIFSLPFFAMAGQTDWEGIGDNEDVSVGLPQGTTIENPQATPAAGTYSSTQSVVLTTENEDHNSIRYTTDGSDPACPDTGTLYTEAISISSSTTVKAIACYAADDSYSSDVSTFAYTISSGGGRGTGSYTPPAPEPEDFENRQDCEAEDFYWYDDACHADSQSAAEDFSTQSECEAEDLYWYDDACHAEPESAGQTDEERRRERIQNLLRLLQLLHALQQKLGLI